MYKDIRNRNINNLTNAEARRLFEIPKVPVAAAAGYARSFGDDEYVRNLETIKIPFEPYGIARAFDITGDSMEPVINDGMTVVGIKVDAAAIKDNKQYIIVSADGVQCKNIRMEPESEFIYLISKNEKYPPRHLRKGDVMEVWEVWKTL